MLNITNPDKLVGSSITINGGVPIQCTKGEYDDTQYVWEFRRDDGDDCWEIILYRNGGKGKYVLECKHISRFGIANALPECKVLDKRDVGNEQTILREIYHMIKVIGR